MLTGKRKSSKVSKRIINKKILKLVAGGHEIHSCITEQCNKELAIKIDLYMKSRYITLAALRNSLVYTLEKNYKLISIESDKIEIGAINTDESTFIFDDTGSIEHRKLISNSYNYTEEVQRRGSIAIVLSDSDLSSYSIKIKTDTKECKDKLINVIEEAKRLVYDTITKFNRATNSIIQELGNIEE